MPVHGVLNHGRVPVKIWAPIGDVESNALTQLSNVSKLPYVFKHVAAMADVHVGFGVTVGSVIATQGMLMPCAVGVDIGCGMIAIKTPLDAKRVGDNIQLLRHRIESAIPLGPEGNDKITKGVENWKGWRHWDELHALDKKRDNKLYKTARIQLGSLGGGNHFIEICLDTENNVWVMLHSGSRNVGKTLAERHMSIAKKLVREAGDKLPDPELAYFLEHEDEFSAYYHDLMWAQKYAAQNRVEMMDRVLAILAKTVTDEPNKNIKRLMEVNCHHNYVAKEIHYDEQVLITRKGAVSAQENEYGIIPGSMGTKSYIVKGKGCAESFHSCSHGAGRRMSRGKAKQHFTLEDLAAQTAGVECNKGWDVLDEIPGAYKDIDVVMNNQTDLVEIVATLKQILCVKG